MGSTGFVLLVRATHRAEHAGLGELGLISETDTSQVDVPLSCRHVGVARTGLQRGRTDPGGGGVRQVPVATIMERADGFRDLRLRKREPERDGVVLRRQRPSRLGMAEHTIVIAASTVSSRASARPSCGRSFRGGQRHEDVAAFQCPLECRIGVFRLRPWFLHPGAVTVDQP